jgi:hypothetical protein
MPNATPFQTLAAIGFALVTGACSSVPAGRSAIDEVSVFNLHTVSASDVEDKLASAASPKFLGLFRGVVYDYNVFDESSLQRDLARVERYLRGHGFLDAKARAGRVVRVSSKHVQVEIVAEEGPPTVNRNVVLAGIEALPPDVRDDVTAVAKKTLPVGARFDEIAFKRADSDVKKSLTDSGYAFAKVTSQGQIDPSAHVADYVITIVPGDPATLGAVTIDGLDPDGAGPRVQEIPENAVRRALDLAPGDKYSTAKIESATQALLDLSVFSSVEITPVLPDPPPANHLVPIKVHVEPTRLRVLKLGGGAEFDVFKTELHILTGWENHNLFGGLRDFSVNASPGLVLYPTRVDNLTKPTNPLPEEHFRMQLRQPSCLEARTACSIRPELNVFPLLVAPDPSTADPVVGYVEFKTTIAVDRTFWKKLYVSLGYTIQVEDPFVYVGALDSALRVLVLGYPQLVTNLDFRDSAIRPHRGIYLGNSLQVAGVGGDARDVRIQPEVRRSDFSSTSTTRMGRTTPRVRPTSRATGRPSWPAPMPCRRPSPFRPSRRTSRPCTSAASFRVDRAPTAASRSSESRLTVSSPSSTRRPRANRSSRAASRRPRATTRASASSPSAARLCGSSRTSCASRSRGHFLSPPSATWETSRRTNPTFA